MKVNPSKYASVPIHPRLKSRTLTDINCDRQKLDVLEQKLDCFWQALDMQEQAILDQHPELQDSDGNAAQNFNGYNTNGLDTNNHEDSAAAKTKVSNSVSLDNAGILRRPKEPVNKKLVKLRRSIRQSLYDGGDRPFSFGDFERRLSTLLRTLDEDEKDLIQTHPELIQV